jgi:mannose-6-phosphate isomerase-like protein (cupin superfamily)
MNAQDILAPKGQPAVYTAPHKPHTKLAEVKAKHAGEAEWRELIVNDEHLRSEYVQSKSGSTVPKCLHPDTRTWWVIMDGQIRFEIEGQAPFVASKGSIVQVPMATFFTFETIGDKPALRFETNIAGAKTLYAKGIEPPPMPGFDWVPVKFARKPGIYGRNNKPHVTFDEVAKALDAGKLKGTQAIVDDDRGAANFIYGYEKNLPPINPKAKGHYHPEGAEYWLIMAGKIRYPIEKVGVVIAEPGDVVYVPKFTYHFPRWYGEGASCRLAMNGYPSIAHLFDAAE